MMTSLWCAPLTMLGLVVVFPDVSHSYPVHRRLFKLQYRKPVRCELCHAAGGTEQNQYGKDWKAAGEQMNAFARIEPLDSDRDGITNRDELRADSNPGDKRSTPTDPGKTWRKVQDIPIPSEQLVLVMDRVDSVQAAEPDLTAEQIGRIERGIQRPLDIDDRYPTIYFGVKDNHRVAVAVFQHFQLPEGRFSMLVGMDTSGRVKKVILFRAGSKDGGAYGAYLNCLVGRGKGEISEGGTNGCPAVSGRMAAQRGIALAVRKALWTVVTLYAKH